MEIDQIEAVTADTDVPLCVFAGPGSGKTRVILERLKFLNVLARRKCLVLTFSKAAVAELSTRLQSVQNLEHCEITTFHSFAFRHVILRHWRDLGYLQSPKIVSGANMLRDLLQEHGHLSNLFPYSHHKHEQKAILKTLQRAKSRVDPFQYLSNSGLHSCAFLLLVFDDALKRNNQMLFSDMVHLAYKFLQLREDLMSYLKRKYDHVLVDEYQDTNEVQNALLLMLAEHGRVSIVGDSDQLIFAFQGAERKNLRDFLAYFESRDMRVKKVSLRVNFRSAPAIIAAGNVIANAPFTNGNNMGGVFSTINNSCRIASIDTNPPQLKEMIANRFQHPCISEPASFANFHASKIGSSPKFLSVLPLGAVVITACLKADNAEFEYVSAILNSLVLPKTTLMPSESSSSCSSFSSSSSSSSSSSAYLSACMASPIASWNYYFSSSSSSSCSTASLSGSPRTDRLRVFDHETMIERVPASDIAILFRRNSVGKQLLKYLKHTHPDLNFVWKSRKDTGNETEIANDCPLRLFLQYLTVVLNDDDDIPKNLPDLTISTRRVLEAFTNFSENNLVRSFPTLNTTESARSNAHFTEKLSVQAVCDRAQAVLGRDDDDDDDRTLLEVIAELIGVEVNSEIHTSNISSRIEESPSKRARISARYLNVSDGFRAVVRTLLDLRNRVDRGDKLEDIIQRAYEDSGMKGIVDRYFQIQVQLPSWEVDEYDESWRRLMEIVAIARVAGSSMCARQDSRQSFTSTQLEIFIRDFWSLLVSPPVVESPDAITLGTVHSSKGREWRVVLLVSADSMSFPWNVSPNILGQYRSDDDNETVRNLVYVACSRAKERMFISFEEPPTASGSVDLARSGLSPHLMPLIPLIPTGQVQHLVWAYHRVKSTSYLAPSQCQYQYLDELALSPEDRAAIAACDTAVHNCFSSALSSDDRDAMEACDAAVHHSLTSPNRQRPQVPLGTRMHSLAELHQLSARGSMLFDDSTASTFDFSTSEQSSCVALETHFNEAHDIVEHASSVATLSSAAEIPHRTSELDDGAQDYLSPTRVFSGASRKQPSVNQSVPATARPQPVRSQSKCNYGDKESRNTNVDLSKHY